GRAPNSRHCPSSSFTDTDPRCGCFQDRLRARARGTSTWTTDEHFRTVGALEGPLEPERHAVLARSGVAVVDQRAVVAQIERRARFRRQVDAQADAGRRTGTVSELEPEPEPELEPTLDADRRERRERATDGG